MSKLDDILDEVTHTYGASSIEVADRKTKARQHVKDLMLELIGQFELERNYPTPSGKKNYNADIRARNRLRAELRQKVEEL